MSIVGVPIVPDIVVSNATVTEGGSLSFQVTLSKATAATVSVNYATANDTAGALDYTAKSGTLTFAPGETTKTVTVSTTQDNIDELTEFLKLNLSGAVNGAILDGEGIGTITDDDDTPQVKIAPLYEPVGQIVHITEGEIAYFRISLNRPSSQPITVNFETLPFTAGSSDYVTSSGTLTFTPGETIKDISISTEDDNIDELSETFDVQLSNPVNAVFIDSLTGKGTVQLTDNDPLPTMTIVGSTITEGDEVGGVPMVFTVNLSHPSSRPITVEYATASGTAVAGLDFVAASGLLTFAPGSTSQSFSIGMIGDDRDEGVSESFTVSLANPSNAIIQTALAAGTINDDDETPIAKAIASPASLYQIIEGSGLTVNATQSTDGDTTKLIYRWDFNDDGLIDIITLNPVATLSSVTLAAMGLNDGPNTITVRLEVSDGVNFGTASVAVEVINVAPTFQTGGNVNLPPEASGILKRVIQVHDQGLADILTARINYGDGTPVQTVVLPSKLRELTLDHAYSSAGQFNVVIEVNDGTDTTTNSFQANVTLGSALPTVTFANGDVTVSETSGKLTLTAQLSVPSAEEVSVPISFSGTATNGLDYDLTATYFTFAIGSTTATVDLLLRDDTVQEPLEVLKLQMGIPSGARLGNITTKNISIQSDDVAPIASFAGTQQTAEEGEAVTITARLSTATSQDVVIPLTFSGAATETGRDEFQFPGAQMVIPAGSLSVSRTLVVVDDIYGEKAQSLVIQMGTPTGAVLSTDPSTPTSHTILIPANDTPIVELRSASMIVDESAGTLMVRVDLSNPIEEPVSLPFTITGTAQSGEDFTYSPGTPLVFAAFQTSAAIDLTVIDDLLVEPFDMETVVLTFEDPSVGLLGGTRIFELSIRDNDVQRIDFTVPQQLVWEDDGKIILSVRSTLRADVDIEVPLIFSLGNASLSDFAEQLPTSIIIPAGKTSASIDIQLANDTVNESTESFSVRLGTPPGGGLLGTNSMQTVKVKDNDPYVYLGVDASTTNEVNRGVDFVIRLSAPSNKDVVINFLSTGTATQGTDYTLSHQSSITILAGETIGRVTAYLADDPAVELVETIGIKLTGASGAIVFPETASAQFSIRNDDKSFASFGSLPTSVREGSAFNVKVNLSESLPHDVLIPITIDSISTARNFSDYTLYGLDSQNRLLIKAGSKTGSFTVKTIDDRFIEQAESIQFRLGSSNSALLDVDTNQTLRYYIDASDTPSGQVYRVPTGFGLNDPIQPGEVAIDTTGPISVVTMDADGNEYVLPDAQAQKIIDQLKAAEAAKVQISVPTTGTGTTGTGGNKTTGSGLPAVGSGNVALTIGNGNVIASTPIPTEVIAAPTLSTSSISNIPVSTVAIDLSGSNSNFFGSTVFFDANFNGVADFVDLNGDGVQSGDEPSEPTAITSLDGTVKLDLPYKMDINGDGIISSTDGRFVLIGGVDTATQLPLQLRLESAVGHHNIGPISTLASKLVSNFGVLPTEAELRALESLGLEGSTFANVDVINSAATGDISAARVALANAKLQSTAMTVASLFSTLDGAPSLTALGDIVYQQMAKVIRDAGSLLELQTEASILSLIYGVEFETGLSIALENNTVAAQHIAAGNAKLQNLDVTSNTFLYRRAQVEIVLIGQLAPALAQLSAGTITAAQIGSDFETSSFDLRVEAAVPGILSPPKVSVTHYRALETDTTGILRYEVSISGDVTHRVVVNYETVGDQDVQGEFTPISGSLVWEIGDTAPKLLEVHFVGDTEFEADEAVLLVLTSAENAVLTNEVGIGYIVNDDEFHFTTADNAAGSQLYLSAAGTDAAFYSDGIPLFEGSFSEGALTNIYSTSGSPDIFTIDLQAGSTYFKQGLTFHGNDDGDELIIESFAATEIVHTITGSGFGSYLIDGQRISYNSLALTNNQRSITILGLPSQLSVGNEILLGRELGEALPLDRDSGTTWKLRLAGNEVATSNLLEFGHLFDSGGDYEIELQVAIDGGPTVRQVIHFEVSALPPNIAPVASAGGNYILKVGDTLFLDASLSSDVDQDTLTYQWDLDGDGNYGDATGVAPVITWQQLAGLGISNTGEHTISVLVSDGIATDSANATLIIEREATVELVFSNNPATVGTKRASNQDPTALFHEWTNSTAELWLTIDELTPLSTVDVQWEMELEGTLFANPLLLNHLGNSGNWDVDDSGSLSSFTGTLLNVSLAGYQIGDRVLIATIRFPKNVDDIAGVSMPTTAAYPSPTNQHGVRLVRAGIVGSESELVVDPNVPGYFAPVVYDLNDDGKVGLGDFALFIVNYGKAVTQSKASSFHTDFDQNGKVGLADFALFIQHYGSRKTDNRVINMPFMVVNVPSNFASVESEPLPFNTPSSLEPSVKATVSLVHLEGEPDSSFVPPAVTHSAVKIMGESTYFERHRRNEWAATNPEHDTSLTVFDAYLIDAVLQDATLEFLLVDAYEFVETESIPASSQESDFDSGLESIGLTVPKS